MIQVYTAVCAEAKQQSRALLSAAVLRHWGISPLPPIAIAPHGKPHFPDSPYHFNLSHSANIALCALSDCPVGADIQLPRPSRPRFLDQVCSEPERHWLKKFGDIPDAFALLWAMKESAVKYSGRGITRPLSAITVPLPDTLPTDDNWLVLPKDDLFFAVCTLHKGMVSICSKTHPQTKSEAITL